MTCNKVQPLNILTKRIIDAESGFKTIMDSLPQSVKPYPFAGFNIQEPPPKNNRVLLGWSYDWADKGDNPPPWSDWPDKEG